MPAAVFVSPMFTIIGGDNREYGPVSTDQVRAWINAGRANLDTKARAVGSDEWRRLGDFPEFAPPAEPPPILAAPPAIPGAGPTQPDPNLASLWARFGGAVIDGFLSVLCCIPAMTAAMATLRDRITDGQQPTPAEAMMVLSQMMTNAAPILIGLVIVQAVLLGLRGQSIGKLIVRTRIVRHSDGIKAGFVRAFLIRSIVPALIESLPLVGALFLIVNICFIFGDQRRCLHDYIAGTKVVRA